MLSHAAVTSVARLPQTVRGRSLGFATLGFQVGAGLMPAAGILVITMLGWAMSWRVVAGFLALALLAMLALRPREALRPVGDGADRTMELPPFRTALPPAPPGLAARSALLDPVFPPCWPRRQSPPAISSISATLPRSGGWGVGIARRRDDRLRARIRSRSDGGGGSWPTGSDPCASAASFLVPLALAGLLLLGPGAHDVPGLHGTPTAQAVATALAFFALVGLTGGASQVTVTGVLADLYGTDRIGMIRAMAAAIMVVASALTPGLFGIAVDAGIGFGVIGIAGAAYCLAASGLAILLPARPMH